jgi:hypothetical protein
MKALTDVKVAKLQREAWEEIESDPAWLSVLAAGGWATKGPDCDGTGGVC